MRLRSKFRFIGAIFLSVVIWHFAAVWFMPCDVIVYRYKSYFPFYEQNHYYEMGSLSFLGIKRRVLVLPKRYSYNSYLGTVSDYPAMRGEESSYAWRKDYVKKNDLQRNSVRAYDPLIGDDSFIIGDYLYYFRQNEEQTYYRISLSDHKIAAIPVGGINPKALEEDYFNRLGILEDLGMYDYFPGLDEAVAKYNGKKPIRRDYQPQAFLMTAGGRAFFKQDKKLYEYIPKGRRVRYIGAFYYGDIWVIGAIPKS